MRFLFLRLSWCVTLLILGRCDDTYRAEVYVVASNPQEYGVSVVSSNYPSVVVNTNQDNDDSKQGTEPISSTSSSSSSSTLDNNLTRLEDLSDSSSGKPHDTPPISALATPLNTSARQREVVSSTRNGTIPSKAEVSAPFHCDSTDVPVRYSSQSSGAQQTPCNTFNQTDTNSKTNINLNCQATSCSMPSKYSSSRQAQTQGEQRTPFNNNETKEVRPNGIQIDKTPTTQFTPNGSTGSQGITNHRLINRTESSRRTQSNQPTTVHQTLTDQTRSQDQQIENNQQGAPALSPISQSANIQQPSTNETSGPTQATINQLVVLPSYQANKTGPIPEIPNNQTGSNKTETEKGAAQENQSNQRPFNQTAIPTLPTASNQTEANKEIPPNEIESLLSELHKLETRERHSPRLLNKTERDEIMKRRLEKRRMLARNRSAYIANLNREANETSPLRTTNQTPNELEKWLEENGLSPNILRRRKRTSKPRCTCVEEVIARTAKCKMPCSKTAKLTTVLFYHALVVWIVYVFLLALSYRRFCRKRREEEEWRRDALKWKCRERRMRWLTKMFS